jgi:outer membrane receptor protein involved in Fe transport
MTDFVFPTRNTALAALATAFEWRRFKAQASMLGTFVFENVGKQNAYKPDNKAEYTPAVFASYQPLAERSLTLRAFYKRIFRMPTFNDLYYTDIGNIALKPEYTVQHNLGFAYRKLRCPTSDISPMVAAFRAKITLKIVSMQWLKKLKK